MRPTLRTGVWLCMEPAISRIIIFFLTASTHLELFHRGVRAIVGEFLDDAEPRTAICAVREWISVSPICWIKYFLQTMRANRDVRKNERGLRACLLAVANFETSVARRV